MLAVLSLLTACAAPAAAPDDSTGAAPSDPAASASAQAAPDQTTQPGGAMLDGEWQLVGYGPSDAQTPPVAGTTITASFADSTISGSGGCNSYSGPYTLDGDALSVGDLIRTERACLEQAAMQQEDTFLAALQSAQSLTRAADSLTISYDGGELRFEPVAPVADAELEGVEWRLESIVTGDTASSVIAGSNVTASFADGNVTGSGGCNGYGGDYTVDGANLSISQVISTMMACDGGVTEQETAFFTALQSATGYAIDGDRLTITHGGGALQFMRAE